jgi:hypothetical protein
MPDFARILAEVLVLGGHGDGAQMKIFTDLPRTMPLKGSAVTYDWNGTLTTPSPLRGGIEGGGKHL